MQGRGQGQNAGVGQQSQRRQSGIHVQTSGETDGDQRCRNFVWRESYRVQHLCETSDLRTNDLKDMPAFKIKGPPQKAAQKLDFVVSYRVDSISKPQASSKGSGMYLEFLFRRAHSRKRVDRKYWSGESLYSRTTCSNSVIVGVIGPMGSGLPQFGFPRRFAMKITTSLRWR